MTKPSVFVLLITGLIGTLLATATHASTSAPPAIGPTPPPRIIATLNPIANFAYQLDCISDVLRSCGGRDEFAKLWLERFGVAKTASEVDGWRNAMSHSQDLQVRLRVASFEASSLDDYLRRIDVLLDARAAKSVRQEVRSRYPNFLAWWRASNANARSYRVADIRRALVTPPISVDIPSLYAFFDVPSSASTELRVALLYRPTLGELNLTTGETVGGGWAVAEFGPTEDIANRLGVVLHEYTHFVYSLMPTERRAALQKAIVDADAAHGRAAAMLFNEAVATAFGNGRIYRELATPEAWKAQWARPRSLYNDGPTDAAAKAILPLVDDMLARSGGVSTEGFPALYTKSLNDRLGPMWSAPTLLMREYKALADDRFDKAVVQESIRAFNASSVWYDTAPCCGPGFDSQWRENAGYNRFAIIDRAHAPATTLLAPDLAAIFAQLPDTIAGIVIQTQGQFLDLIVVAGPEGAHAAIQCLAHSASLEPGVQLCSSVKDDPRAAALYAEILALPKEAALPR